MKNKEFKTQLNQFVKLVGRRRWITMIAAFLLLGLFVFPKIVPKPPLKRGVALSHAVYDQNDRLLRLSVSRDDKYRLWLPLEEQSKLLVKSTLLKEDKYFWFHPGFNPISLVRGFWSSYIVKSNRMGGSTITMQLARIRYKINTQSISGKIKQIFKAMQLEIYYSKKEILEAYLNLAPYGGNVEGAGAASLVYFSEKPKDLVLSQALALSVIPQKPSRITGEGLKDAYERIVAEWLERYPKDEVRKDQFIFPHLVGDPQKLPFEAPHFVESLIGDHPEESVLKTTLDLDLQHLVERQITKYIQRKQDIGIKNASALLIDARNMGVVASVGSSDYFNEVIEGQVNGVRARRSPGSALKPFVYALAMDQGLIHPMSMLKDSPYSYGGFNPENFDNEFSGPVTAKEALTKSRNIPAVHLASILNGTDLYGFVEKGGVNLPYNRDHYGMALVLGGAELTMEELIKLYALFPNKGKLLPLRFLTNEPMEKGEQLLSPETCFLTMDILNDNPRPGQHYQSQWVPSSSPVAWKTGTSYAFRDAWTVGIIGPYVLAVWIGNFDGEGNPAFVGRQAAAPLFFEIVDAIDAQKKKEPYSIWAIFPNVKEVKVCAVSGQIPNAFCPHEIETWYIPGKSPIDKCEIHREVMVDARTGMRSCPELHSPHDSKVYEFWPSDLLKIFRMAGVPRRVPPHFHPDCPVELRDYQGLPPKITSPKKGIIYNARVGTDTEEKIPMASVTDGAVKEVYWFINKKYFGKAKGDEILFWKPQPGQYVVRAVDDQGRSDVVDVTVNAIN